MYPIPQNEKLIETKICRKCQASFPITDKDMEFYDKISPIFNWQKFSVPSPTLCPDCRMCRRLAFRNERKLYKRKCNATGKEIVSIYSPDKPHVVYDIDYWWSDKWDPMSYGLEFDFSKTFSEQFSALLLTTPTASRSVDTNELSDYTNESGFLERCYLVFEAGFDKDCYFGDNLIHSTNIIDSSYIRNSENCYELVDCTNCFGVFYSNKLTDCRDCLFCYNLKNKQYCILNKQYTKEEYEKIKPEVLSQSARYLTLYKSTIQSSIHEHVVSINSVGVGDHLFNCSDTYYCFDATECENVKYSSQVYVCKNCYDVISFGNNSEQLYECMWVGTNVFHSLFSSHCYNDFSDVYYSMKSGFWSKHLFGCIWLRNKQYCILNKQYTKEQYEALVPKIIEHMIKTGEWWEFFSPSISPFGYNETMALEYFPVKKETALKQGFSWSDYEAPFPKVEKIIPADKLPDDISKIPDDILNWAIECEVTDKPFRIIKQELEFYRKHNLPIPKRHPDQRHEDRRTLRNERQLFERRCDKCKTSIISSYSPERHEIVYCEKCYNKEMI